MDAAVQRIAQVVALALLHAGPTAAQENLEPVPTPLLTGWAVGIGFGGGPPGVSGHYSASVTMRDRVTLSWRRGGQAPLDIDLSMPRLWCYWPPCTETPSVQDESSVSEVAVMAGLQWRRSWGRLGIAVGPGRLQKVRTRAGTQTRTTARGLALQAGFQRTVNTPGESWFPLWIGFGLSANANLNDRIDYYSLEFALSMGRIGSRR